MSDLANFPISYLFALFLLFSIGAAYYVHRMSKRLGKIWPRRRLRGLELARLLLDQKRLFGVPVEKGSVDSWDGYNEATCVLRLPGRVYDGSSFWELGEAARETAEAFLHAEGSLFPWLKRTVGKVIWVALPGVIPFFIFGLLVSSFWIKFAMTLFVVAILLKGAAVCLKMRATREMLHLLREGRAFDADELALMERSVGVALLGEIAKCPEAVLKVFSLGSFKNGL